jgi:uncharacterized membrane-anchored protein
VTARTVRALIGFLVLAPALAAVIIATLLLVGVDPHLVFLPGHFVKSWLHVPNAVGVLATEAVWWAIILAVWLVLRREKHQE